MDGGGRKAGRCGCYRDGAGDDQVEKEGRQNSKDALFKICYESSQHVMRENKDVRC